MNRLSVHVRLLGAIALTFMLLGTTFGSAAAADTSTLTIHKRVCPAGQVITDIFEDCHDILPEQTVEFTLDDGVPRAVDDEGNTSFTELAAGTYTVAEVEGPPLDFVHLRVWCSVQGTTTNPAEEMTVDLNTFDVTLKAGEEVVCDVYNIAEDLSGRTPTVQPTAQPTGAATSITLPGTGSGTGSGGVFGLFLTLGAILLAISTVVSFSIRRADRRLDS